MNKYEDMVLEARDLWDEDRLEEALELLEEAQVFNYELDLESINDMGLIYFELGKYEKSEETFLRLIEYDDEYYGAYYGLGMLKEKDGFIDEAIELYKESINFNNDNPLSYFSLANLYDDKNMVKKAIELYKKTIILNSDHFWAHINLGSIYEEQKEFENALFHFNRAYEIDSENAIAAFNLGVVHQNLGNIKEAKSFYLESIENDAPYIYSFLNYGILLKDYDHNLKGAIDSYSQGLEYDSNLSVLYYNRGCAFALLKQYNEAIDDIVKSIELNPDLKNYMFEDEELNMIRETDIFKNKLQVIDNK